MVWLYPGRGATAGVSLGAEVLELGPGWGAATAWLQPRVSRLVAVEHEQESRSPGWQRSTRAARSTVVSGDAAVPGGVFLGSDSLASDGLHGFHEGDTYNPVEPAAFLTRLQTTGFAAITLHVGHELIFTARKEE